MMPMFNLLIPRNGLTPILGLIALGWFFLSAFNFSADRPLFLLLIAAIQGAWLGTQSAALHNFARQLQPPRFADRLVQLLITILGVTLLTLACISIANPELRGALALYAGVVVLVTLASQYIADNRILLVVVLLVLLATQQQRLPQFPQLWPGLIDAVNSPLGLGAVTLVVLAVLVLLRQRFNQPKLGSDTQHSPIFTDGDFRFVPKRQQQGLWGEPLLYKAIGSLALLCLLGFLFWLLEPKWQLIEFVALGSLIILPTTTLTQLMQSAPLLWITGAVSSRQQMATKALSRAVVSALPMVLLMIIVALVLQWQQIDAGGQLIEHTLIAFGLGIISLGFVSHYWDYFSERLVRWPSSFFSYLAAGVLAYVELPLALIGSLVLIGTLVALLVSRHNLSHVEQTRS